MIEELVEVLDRSWSSLEKESGAQFALSCIPFHEQLSRETRTAGLLADLRREEAESKSQLRESMNTARVELAAIVEELVKTNPTAFGDPPQDAHDYDTSLDAVRRRLEALSLPTEDDEVAAVGRETNDDDRLGEAIAIVREVCKRAAPSLLQRIASVARARDHARRMRRTYYRTSAASALARWERDLGDLNPPAVSQGQRADLARVGRTRRPGLGGLYEQLFGDLEGRRNSPVEERAVASKLHEMQRDARRIYEELCRRVGTERSLLAVFERYRQRCQWYEADRLQTLAAGGPGKAEDRLTDTLAAYLFDHGLNPLTRPLAGRLQPDLLGPDDRFSFYVEAKQYEDARRSYLLEGMQQVWDMLDQLRGTRFDVSEGFYVIYRRGGPRYSFPPRLQHGDRVVHILMIDIAPSAERGSHAPATLSISAQDVMPRAASEPEGISTE